MFLAIYGHGTVNLQAETRPVFRDTHAIGEIALRPSNRADRRSVPKACKHQNRDDPDGSIEFLPDLGSLYLKQCIVRIGDKSLNRLSFGQETLCNILG